jgi:hypothetical protein
MDVSNDKTILSGQYVQTPHQVIVISAIPISLTIFGIKVEQLEN